MAIEAPLSKYKKNNFKIGIVICLVLAVWCVYDGYFNKGWIEKHTDADGTPQTYLVFNRNAPPVLLAVAVLLSVYLFAVRNKKIIAAESELVINDKKKIPYDSIQKIDKTHFEKKGVFTITYTDSSGGEINCKINDRTYDNLPAILDELVTKIS